MHFDFGPALRGEAAPGLCGCARPPALPVGPPRRPPGPRSVLCALLHLSKAPAAAAIPLQTTKQCAFISFVKYARNANHSDQNSPHQRSMKVIVKVKIASFPRGDLFGVKGGMGRDGTTDRLWFCLNCASKQYTQQSEFVSSTLIVVI